MVKLTKLQFMLMMTLVAAITVGCNSGTATRNPQQNAAAVSESQTVALPGEQPALIGRVKEIVGNEVTVFKGEVTQNEGAPRQAPATQTQNQGSQGGRAENRGFGMKFSEETETFLIPVGIPIVTMQRGTGTTNQVGLTEIKKDTILRVWKNEGTVSFVQVAGGNNARSTGQGAGNNGQRTGTGAGAGAGAGIVITPGMGGSPPPGMGGSR